MLIFLSLGHCRKADTRHTINMLNMPSKLVEFKLLLNIVVILSTGYYACLCATKRRFIATARTMR